MKSTVSNETEPNSAPPTKNLEKTISFVAWLAASSAVILFLYLGWRSLTGHPVLVTKYFDRPFSPGRQAQSVKLGIQDEQKTIENSFSGMVTPLNELNSVSNTISRNSTLHTIIPNRPRPKTQSYIVAAGDSVFEIASKFNITPETVLWANYDQLKDNPHAIYVGMELLIPPTNGVLYKWQENDTIESVANRFDVNPSNILEWPGNNIDLVDQQIEPGTLVMVPGGHREFQQWIIPTIPRGRAGVSRAVYGSGACAGGYDGLYGDGSFIWPADNHTLSGNDYWSGHLAIDIAAGEGARIYAADSGVVVFAGWATGGYGNTVIIDHGNGYQTLYGHLSSVNVRCGQSVTKGSVIGYAGSTGNSTGPHLHFEVRYQGGFVNPWYVLPAP